MHHALVSRARPEIVETDADSVRIRTLAGVTYEIVGEGKAGGTRLPGRFLEEGTVYFPDVDALGFFVAPDLVLSVDRGKAGNRLLFENSEARVEKIWSGQGLQVVRVVDWRDAAPRPQVFSLSRAPAPPDGPLSFLSRSDSGWSSLFRSELHPLDGGLRLATTGKGDVDSRGATIAGGPVERGGRVVGMMLERTEEGERVMLAPTLLDLLAQVDPPLPSPNGPPPELLALERNFPLSGLLPPSAPDYCRSND